MNKKIAILRVVSVILLIATAVLIYYFSAQPAVSSSKTSGGLTYKICRGIYPSFDDKPDAVKKAIIKQYHNPVRKIGHIVLYSLLSFFAFLSAVSYKKISFAARNVACTGFCVAFSISDEVHQLFVNGRSGMPSDVLIDCIGVFAAAAVLTVIFSKTGLKSIAFSEA